MEVLPDVIIGGSHTDERGTLTFFNTFDMSLVKRFYIIQHPDTIIIRAWRAHRIEQRWFKVSQGSFKVSLVKIDHWETPDPNLKMIHFELNAIQNTLLHVPAGYASSLQATETNSSVLVFADHSIEHAKNDDYLYPNNYFNPN